MIRLLLSFLLLCVMCTSTFAADGLYVKGNKIFYGNRKVLLQGVAVGDPILARAERPLSDYEFLAQDWNINVVRISIHPGVWQKYGPERVMRVLRQNVDAALKARLFVIITWHAIGVPNIYTQEPPPGYTDNLYNTDLELAKTFWNAVSQEFGNDGRIMFELWNEPVWPKLKDNVHLLPKWTLLKPYWKELVQLVRSNSNNLLIVTSSGWGYNLQGIRQSPINDNNTAYAWHVYSGTDNNDPNAWERNLDGLSKVKPVLVTEWGFEPDNHYTAYFGDAKTYGYLFADSFLKDKELHHTAWCWHPIWTPRMLKSDWKSLTPFGDFVKIILWRTPRETLVRP